MPVVENPPTGGTTMGRQQGPIKGLAVITNPNSAESAIFELEPYVCADDAEYQSIINGSTTLQVKVVVDELGIKHMEFVTSSSST